MVSDGIERRILELPRREVFRSSRVGCGVGVVDCARIGAVRVFGVDGHVARPAERTLDQLKALRPVTVSLTFQSDHGPQTGTWTGALLQAAPVDSGSDKSAPLQHTILARGRDGYGVALAIGEIDPRFAGKEVIVAYQRDGKPMENQTFRLVVPGDAHGGRSVNDLVSLTIN